MFLPHVLSGLFRSTITPHKGALFRDRGMELKSAMESRWRGWRRAAEDEDIRAGQVATVRVTPPCRIQQTKNPRYSESVNINLCHDLLYCPRFVRQRGRFCSASIKTRSGEHVPPPVRIQKRQVRSPLKRGGFSEPAKRK